MHFFSAYSIKVVDRRLTHFPPESRYARLDDIGGHSLQSIVEEFAEAYKQMIPVESNMTKRVFSVSSCYGENEVRYGWIEVGDVGTEGKIVNTDTQQTMYTKGVNDSDISTVFYYLHVPEESQKALVFFHIANGRSCKALLEKQLRKYLRQRHRVGLEFKAVCDQGLLKNWIDHANVREIHVKQKKSEIGSVDVADGLESSAEVTSVIKSRKRKGVLMALRDVFGDSGDSHASSSRKLVERIEAEAEELKLVAELNGKKKTFLMNSHQLPEMLVEIDEKVKFSDTDAATIAMVRLCKGHSKDFLPQL